MRYLLTVEAFKSNILSKIFNQIGKDEVFKGAIKAIQDRLHVDLFNLKDSYFKYYKTEEAIGKRGDYLKLWFSTEDGMLLMTRKNVKVNTSTLEQSRSSSGGGYGKNTSSGFDYRHFDLNSIKKYTDYCVLINIEKILADNATTKEVRTKRSENPPLKINNDAIKNANLDRYRKLMVDKYDFSTEEASIVSVNKIVKTYIRKDNVIYLTSGNISQLTDALNYLIQFIMNLKKVEESELNNDGNENYYRERANSYLENLKGSIHYNILKTDTFKPFTKESKNKLKEDLRESGYTNASSEIDRVGDIIDSIFVLLDKMYNFIKSKQYKSVGQVISIINKVQSIRQLEGHIDSARFGHIKDFMNAYLSNNMSTLSTYINRFADYKVEYRELLRYAIEGIDDLS